MDGEPLRVMVAFDRWASRRVFEACGALGEGELDRRFEIGLGSLRRTLIHVVANMEYWFDRATGQDPPRFDSPAGLPLAAIVERYERVWEQVWGLVSGAEGAFLQAAVTSEFREPGETFVVRFPRSGALLHLLNHGTHHRAQCLNMLRQLGVERLPEIDLIDSCQELVEHRVAGKQA